MSTDQAIIQSKRNIFAWALYDSGMFAFTTVVTTFIFAAYFTSKIASNVIAGSKQWGFAIAIGSLIIVILSPIFGSIADYLCIPAQIEHRFRH